MYHFTIGNFVGLFPLAIWLVWFVVYSIARRAAVRRAMEEKAERERQAAAQQAEKRRQAEENEKRRQEEKAARQAAQQLRQAEKAAKLQERLAIAQQIAECKERELKAAQELEKLRAGSANQAGAAPVVPAVPVAPAAPAVKNRAMHEKVGNVDVADIDGAAFQGDELAFTGKIPGFTRENCIKIAEIGGGKGWQHINTRCTILVVGIKPGMTQLNQADEWATRKITYQEFLERAGLAA